MTHPVIKALLSFHGYFALYELRELCGMHDTSLRERLNELRAVGCIEQHPKQGKRTLYRVSDRDKLQEIADERTPMVQRADAHEPDPTVPLAELLGYKLPKGFIKARHMTERHNPDVTPRYFGPYCHSSIEYI